jgi:TetR/AcrR family transcriptional regulator
MPDEPIDRILEAAYVSFTRHGIRRTTMDDIAAAAGMSRPAVYQYVRNKDDAFRRLANQLFDGALAQAQAAAERDEPLPARLYHVIGAKLELTAKLFQDTPHAAELLDAGARLTGDLGERFVATIRDLVVTALAEADDLDFTAASPAEVADIMLAFVYGMEKELTNPRRARRQLRTAIELLLAGMSRQ